MIREKIKQLRPREETYTRPEDKIQSFLLSEATSASTYFEGVIAACHNNSRLPETKFKQVIMKDSYVNQFLSAADKATGKSVFATTKKSIKEKQQILWDFAQVCKSKLPSGKSDAGAGQSKKGVSPTWKKLTTKRKDTSKADILVSNNRTSVKGPSAQLMSGEQKETRATILAALEISGESGDLKEKLLSEVDKFVTSTKTVGADINSRVLKQMSVGDATRTGNKRAKEIVDQQESMKKEITKVFESAFKDPNVGRAFAQEAMTGYEKFGGKAFGMPGDTDGEATHMLIWDYRMDRLKFTPINSALISKSAAQMLVRPDLKSNSYKRSGVKAGYSFYQSLRVSVEVLLNKQGELESEVKEQIKHYNGLLTEGNINEVDFKKLVGKAYEFFKNKIISIWKSFTERISKIRDAVVNLVSRSIDDALAVFELDVSVKVNTTVRL
jgi:hypothetical protein